MSNVALSPKAESLGNRLLLLIARAAARACHIAILPSSYVTISRFITDRAPIAAQSTRRSCDLMITKDTEAP